ncbi:MULTISPECIES: TIGR01620 family protein [unclassified Pseudoalteromonas]|uniref:TIGR01620 family protein n=1 Tax=unclassified Pseudoalteromonas TaxID=194690 RepID=UPI000B1DC143|nr:MULTISPECIES: TIGR01620 family protein [unclassified Pseudoalteromonas]
MNSNKTVYQQGRVIETLAQDDVAQLLESAETLQTGAKIDDDTEHFNESDLYDMESEPSDENAPNMESVYKNKPSSLLKKTFVLSLVTLIIAELGLTVYQSFNSSLILGCLYSALIVSALGLISKVFIKEYRQLKRLKSNQLQRTDANRLLHSQQIGEAISWLNKLNQHQEILGFIEFKNTLEPHHTDKEVMTLYSNTVLTKQDENAQKLINKYALESGLMVALSPIALVDMAAVLWRGTKLIESIAKVYGIPLGYLSRIKLYRLLAKQMLFAGSAELVSDLATTALGAELAGKISARAGQGISAGIFTTRIGYKAMELSRPVPCLENKRKLLANSMSLLVKGISKRD